MYEFLLFKKEPSIPPTFSIFPTTQKVFSQDKTGSFPSQQDTIFETPHINNENSEPAMLYLVQCPLKIRAWIFYFKVHF